MPSAKAESLSADPGQVQTVCTCSYTINHNCFVLILLQLFYIKREGNLCE